MLKGFRLNLNFQIPHFDFILIFFSECTIILNSGSLNATPFSEFCLCILYICYVLSIKKTCVPMYVYIQSHRVTTLPERISYSVSPTNHIQVEL
jgi:hypothetical protein